MALSKNVFGFEEIEVDNRVDAILIFEEINRELEEYLLEKSIEADSTDGVFDFLEALGVKVQEKFVELTEGNSHKKQLLRVLTRIFALLERKGLHTTEESTHSKLN